MRAALSVTGISAEDLGYHDRPGRSESLADIIEWLFVVFESRLGLTAVVACVHDCCRELDIDKNATSLSIVEQRAFRRLTELAVIAAPQAMAPRAVIVARPVSRNGPEEPARPNG